LGFFEGTSTFDVEIAPCIVPLKKPLEMADYVFFCLKNIKSLTFKISGFNITMIREYLGININPIKLSAGRPDLVGISLYVLNTLI
jgi:hypothetical protein